MLGGRAKVAVQWCLFQAANVDCRYSASFGAAHVNGNGNGNGNDALPSYYQQQLSVSDEASRQELECIASQLGREEAAPIRPFSLNLYARRASHAECSSDGDAKLDNGPDNPAQDGEGNARSSAVDTEYRDRLARDVSAELGADQRPAQAFDIMDMLDAM